MTSSAPSTPPPPKTVSLVWLVPLLALVVSGWLLFREFRHRGPRIEIEFADGAGLQAGHTPVLHKGVLVGTVLEVTLKPDLEGVVAKVELVSNATALTQEGAKYWLVQPEIGLSGVKGLGTLLSGAQIHASPGSGQPRSHFRALRRTPTEGSAQPGRTYFLKSDSLGSLHPGTAVYYRDVKVGVVERGTLALDATHVELRIRVFSPYDRLVRMDTRFWNSGGLSMKVGLLGAQVHSNSLESLVTGGISFATPERETADEPAPAETRFDLHDHADKAWLRWQPVIDLTPAEG